MAATSSGGATASTDDEGTVPSKEAIASAIGVESATSSAVRVVCRVRPLNRKEAAFAAQDGILSSVQTTSDDVVTVTEGEGFDERRFRFDRVFGPSSTQEDVYETCRPIVEAVMSGYNGTIFAYGQTGSGKTFSMEGELGGKLEGVIPRTIGTIFQSIEEAVVDIEFSVQVSYIEIYLERVRDLLSSDGMSQNLSIKEDPATRAVYVEGAVCTYVTSPEEIFDALKEGASNRATSATNMNEHSSRSHAVFLLTVQQKNCTTGTLKTGKLYLVDLAGSEKVRKTGATGSRLEEAKKINQSLSALGQVINKLTDGRSKHIPYRDSKLTRLLQQSLGGNAKTALIICCSPSAYNISETLSTLRFGERAKRIENRAVVNKELSPEEMKQMLVRAEQAIDILQKRIVYLEGELGKLSWKEEDEEEEPRVVKRSIGGRRLTLRMQIWSAKGIAAQRLRAPWG